MKIAFAFWENRIAPVFDTSHYIYVIEVKSEQIVIDTQEVLLEEMVIQKTLRLVELGINTLVCGAISKPMYTMIVSHGIQVIPFVSGELHEVIYAWLRNTLEHGVFVMPGCRGRGLRVCGLRVCGLRARKGRHSGCGVLDKDKEE